MFLDYLKKEKRGSDHTIRCYRSDLNQMEAFMKEAYDECDLTTIQSEWIRSWVVALVKAGKSAENHPSQNERVSHVCEVCQTARN